METIDPSPRCVACGYDIASIGGAPACPECGLTLDAPHVGAARARALLERRLPALVLRSLVVWAAAVAVYAAGAGVVTRSATQGALAMLGIGVAGTIGMG